MRHLFSESYGINSIISFNHYAKPNTRTEEKNEIKDYMPYCHFTLLKDFVFFLIIE